MGRASIGRCNPAGLVHRYIGTAYDTVKFVADNMEDIVTVAELFEYISYYLGVSDTPILERQDGDVVRTGDYYFNSDKDLFGFVGKVTITPSDDDDVEDLVEVEWFYLDIDYFNELVRQTEENATRAEDAADSAAEDAAKLASLDAQAITLPAGEEPTADYDSDAVMLTIGIPATPIRDNLTSREDDYALSANQGTILKEAQVNLVNITDTHTAEIAEHDSSLNTLDDRVQLLEDPFFKGEYVTFVELEVAVPTAKAGCYAYVDAGAGEDVVKYIWDTTDSKWIAQLGESTTETPTSVKIKYESNADTNAFTDSEKTKLGSLVNAVYEDVLDSTRIDSTITANQGRVLKEGQDELKEEVEVLGNNIAYNVPAGSLITTLEDLYNHDTYEYLRTTSNHLLPINKYKELAKVVPKTGDLICNGKDYNNKYFQNPVGALVLEMQGTLVGSYNASGGNFSEANSSILKLRSVHRSGGDENISIADDTGWTKEAGVNMYGSDLIKLDERHLIAHKYDWETSGSARIVPLKMEVDSTGLTFEVDPTGVTYTKSDFFNIASISAFGTGLSGKLIKDFTSDNSEYLMYFIEGGQIMYIKKEELLANPESANWSGTTFEELMTIAGSPFGLLQTYTPEEYAISLNVNNELVILEPNSGKVVYIDIVNLTSTLVNLQLTPEYTGRENVYINYYKALDGIEYVIKRSYGDIPEISGVDVTPCSEVFNARTGERLIYKASASELPSNVTDALYAYTQYYTTLPSNPTYKTLVLERGAFVSKDVMSKMLFIKKDGTEYSLNSNGSDYFYQHPLESSISYPGSYDFDITMGAKQRMFSHNTEETGNNLVKLQGRNNYEEDEQYRIMELGIDGDSHVYIKEFKNEFTDSGQNNGIYQFNYWIATGNKK